jgi:hypothetical protein
MRLLAIVWLFRAHTSCYNVLMSMQRTLDGCWFFETILVQLPNRIAAENTSYLSVPVSKCTSAECSSVDVKWCCLGKVLASSKLLKCRCYGR